MRPAAARPELALRLAGPGDPAPPLLRPPHPSVDVWRDTAGEICAYAYSVDGRHCMDWPAVARFCFDEIGHAITAWPVDGVPLASVERVHRRGVVPAALQRLGFETLHASAVRISGVVLGFLGSSGAGKSTLAHAFAGQPAADAWADDTLVLSISGEGVEAVPIPFDVALRAPSRAHFRGDAPAVLCASGRAPLRALMRLQRGGPDISVRRLGTRESLDAVLPHACTFSMRDAARRRLMVEQYFTLAERVAVFDLAYPSDFAQLPAVVEAVAVAAGVWE